MSRPGRSLQSMLKTVLLTSLAFTVPIALVRFLGGFEGSELAAYDEFVRRRPPQSPDDRVLVVTIGDSDIEALQQYPIHDGTLAQALETLERSRPRAIGLDVARDVPQGSPEGRARLTRTIAKSDTIISGCLLSTETDPGSPPAPGTPKGGAAFADFPIDIDKTVRRVKLISTPAQPVKPGRTKHICNDARSENEISSLSLQAAIAYLADLEVKPDLTADKEIQLRQTVLKRIDSRVGGYAHADTDDYQLLLNYRGASKAFQEVSLSDVLRNRVDPQAVRDRVVLIGYTSKVSKDELNTPYSETESGSRTMPGVVVHAQAVSQILSAVLDQRPLIQSWPEAGELVWIWGWSLAFGLVAFYSRRLGLFLVVTIALGGALWVLCYGVFLAQGVWVPVVPTLVAALLTAFGVRLVDLAGRSGYAQAIYQQMREQLQGTTSRDRKGDYLESLVLRARAARQGQNAAELLAMDTPPSDATPEMKALYDQIATKVRADLAAEQVTRQAAIVPSRNSQATRLQSLLHRAQTSRSHLSAKPDPKPKEPS